MTPGSFTKANRIFTLVFLGAAQITTVARIYIRFRHRRLWWDDGWAFLTMVLTMMITVAVFVTGNPDAGPIGSHNRRIKVIQFWIIMICYSFGAWFARITLILSTVRLIPTIFTLRKISEWAFICFLLMCLGVSSAKVYFCASNKSWHNLRAPVCQLTSNAPLAIGELATFLVADTILVAIPLRLLYRIALPSGKRRMLLLMFSANMITSIVAVLRVVFLINYSSPSPSLTLAIKAEVGTALIVANLAILTPYVYRLINSEGDFDSKPDTYYRSFQPDGGIVMRRVSDLAPDGQNGDSRPHPPVFRI
ncbi:hypothetical protein D9757_001005 [Collybiopsis confluens]|uniref:Rhodopsin domain-containing protein n=1 Tax=Collybiopsis confluens TaxID=2823264 RepID=A0A8H5I0H0_9AGAR|nr:hypothetical protein D9757_001005 [Collybiopsis confluens]